MKMNNELNEKLPIKKLYDIFISTDSSPPPFLDSLIMKAHSPSVSAHLILDYEQTKHKDGIIKKKY